MINLKSLIDSLPYYFKEQDTYKVGGKGLLERYLNIFGDYFDTKVIKNIDTLDDILNIDKTPEIYLGYLWEFLGSMPYANPKAIDPDKWKQYFNGFSDDSTIEALSKVWLYRKDSDNDHYNLTLDQIRSLVKYSIALFSIRGTKKFFEVFLRLYGFEVTISNGSTYPIITTTDDDDSDYYGSDDDYYGSDDDYYGLPESIFDSKSEPTKLDSEELTLDDITLDNRTGGNRIVNINFRLKSEYLYDKDSDEFLRLQDRMFNLINIFLPIGSRPHLIWDNIKLEDSIVNGYENKVHRYVQLYTDRAPIGWPEYSTDEFIPSTEYPGWYRVVHISNWSIPKEFIWAPLRIMVRVVDQPYTGNHSPAFLQDQPKKFKILFSEEYSESEYEDGKVFTIYPGSPISPEAIVSVLCKDDFILSNTNTLFSIRSDGWKKEYNYTLFKHYNSMVDKELSQHQPYIPILIQSAFVRTNTNNADPSDDQFIPQQVINLTTGEYLTFIQAGTTIPDRDDKPIDYSSYEGTNTYVQHIFEPGIYEFIMLSKPEYKLTLEVTRVAEELDVYLGMGSLADNIIDNDQPSCTIRVNAFSNVPFLKNISTLPFYVLSKSGKMWDELVEGAQGALGEKVGNYHGIASEILKSVNLYYVDEDDMDNRRAPLKFYLCFLSKPIHTHSQYIKFTFTQYPSEEHDSWYDKLEVIIYPLLGKVLVESESYRESMDGTPQYTHEYGDDVILSDFSKVSDYFVLGDIQENVGIDSDYSLISVPGVSVRTLTLSRGIFPLAPIGSMTNNEFILEYRGLYDDEVLIKEVSNPVSQYWNNGEDIILGDPGHYRFYGVNPKYSKVNSNYVDVNVQSNKYNALYYLDVYDGDKTDDENYMLRTLIPEAVPDSKVRWGFNFSITLNKSILEATDILTIDPDAFDFEVLLYKGGTPNSGQLIGSYTGTHTPMVDSVDESGNLLPNYKVFGRIDLTWDGSYLGSGNYPPGLYCVELHAKNKSWEGSSSYRTIDAYTVPQKFDGNLYFDVEVISKAWTSPSGQTFDIEPITGRRTWGWYKTNPDQLYSVRLVRYDPSIGIPSFKLKLTNNGLGYTRVYMYKLVDTGSEWDEDVDTDNRSTYPKIIPPYTNNKRWLKEAIPADWGFPGEFDEARGIWDYSKGDTGIPDYGGRWLFTGTVYQLGENIEGPQEPGKYIFIINQLAVDKETINYAYLEVREEINYSLIVNPMLAILQGVAVGTTVDVISSARFTKEDLAVTVTNPDGTLVEIYQSLPYAFYAYQAGTYTFKLYRLEEGHWEYLGLYANFRVLIDSGIYPENLSWEWYENQPMDVQVVTTSQDMVWSIKSQDV